MPPTNTGITIGPARRRKFFEALAEEPSVRKACKAANISRTTLYAMRELDPAFRQQWDKALVIGMHVLIDFRHAPQHHRTRPPARRPNVTRVTSCSQPLTSSVVRPAVANSRPSSSP